MMRRSAPLSRGVVAMRRLGLLSFGFEFLAGIA